MKDPSVDVGTRRFVGVGLVCVYNMVGGGRYIILSVVESTNLMMRMMMEQPEHSFAYAFEAFTIYVGMNITTKNSIWGFVGECASTIF